MFDIPMIYDDNLEQEMQINECIAIAAETYQINPLLLRAIREQERGDIGMIRKNTDKTYDHGPFQINTVHLEQLSRYGINAKMLTYDPCVNVAAGAWHLRRKINEVNKNVWKDVNQGPVWKGVGRYHSKTKNHGIPYMRKIQAIFKKLVAMRVAERNSITAIGDSNASKR